MALLSPPFLLHFFFDDAVSSRPRPRRPARGCCAVPGRRRGRREPAAGDLRVAAVLRRVRRDRARASRRCAKSASFAPSSSRRSRPRSPSSFRFVEHLRERDREIEAEPAFGRSETANDLVEGLDARGGSAAMRGA
jgi:hypothetical protein